jgi:hypothetical protein
VHDDRFIDSADPLRFVDPRYEPRDPIFDVEEPDLPPTVSHKRRRALLAKIAEGDPSGPAME